MKKNTLWTRDFTLIAIGTIITVIGGEAINLPLSLLVFDETKSTLLSSMLIISGMLPDVILPIFIAPFIDRMSKKKISLTLQVVMAAIFLALAFIYYRTGFSYSLFLIFSLIIGTISVVARLAFTAWYPDIIPIGFEQKGFAVFSTIYPTVLIVMAPISTYLYEHVPMHILFVVVSVMTLAFGLLLISFISLDIKADKNTSFDFKEYKSDVKAGFKYILKEKGIRNIYSYMSITNGVGHGRELMTQAYFQTISFVTVTMLGFLRSAETVGRMISGLLQYKINIPANKRYGITKFVYTTYVTLDMILLYTPYPAMLINRFIVGFLGTTSYTLRETSVQSYLPRNMRAKVSAVFSVIFSFSMILFQLFSGYLGEFMDYRLVIVVMSAIAYTGIVVFIILPSKVNRQVYESVRSEENQNSLTNNI